MPTYEYACRGCGRTLEVVQSFSDDPLTTCEDCGGELRKVFSAAGLIFKGSGWHIKDYAGSGRSSGGGTASGSDGASNGGAGAKKDGAAGSSGSSDGAGSATGTTSTGSTGSSGSSTATGSSAAAD